jgi:hypothetical protein
VVKLRGAERHQQVRTLHSLGTNEAGELRFFTRQPKSEEPEGATEEEKELFEFAIGIGIGIDHVTWELIRYTLSAVAERSVDWIKPWLEDAFKGKLDAPVELQITRFALEGLLKDLEATKQQVMLDRIDQLERLADAAL